VKGWRRVPTVEHNKKWIDWVSPDEQWMLSQGHGIPYTAWDLFKKVGGQWRWVRVVPGLKETIQALDNIRARRNS
jgi:hypothetical protein